MDLRPFDRQALDLTAAAIDGVLPGQLLLPTPCGPWNVGELLRHLISQNKRFAAAAAGLDPDAACPYDSGELGDDPAGDFRASADEVTAAFAVSDIGERQVVLPELRGPFPAPVAIGFHVIDFVVHAWDVARSLGRPLDPPAELVEVALRLAAQIPDAARGPGAPFGPAAAVQPDAPSYQRVLGLTGRDPAWIPTLPANAD